MRRIRLVVSVAALMVAMIVVSALPAFAVLDHQHYVVTPNGDRVAVGPDPCGNPESHEGFDHFHGNVHVGTPNQEAFQQENNPVSFSGSPCLR